jgi:hypothetical protein
MAPCLNINRTLVVTTEALGVRQTRLILHIVMMMPEITSYDWC